MSHNIGTVPVLGTPLHIGPDSGDASTSPNTWSKPLAHTPAPDGTKFVILHFMNVDLPASNRLEVDLGYDTDVFTSADGGEFWTRPVNVAAVGGGTDVPIRYITDGSNSGEAFVDRYARGESLQSHAPGHDSITNCDPFLPGAWTEPIFPFPPGTTVPKYDPFWICDKNNPPDWQNIQCVIDGDVRRTVAQGVGMIVTVHGPGGGHDHESVGTCSVTLIDSDLVVLAAHCVSDFEFEVGTSSVTFDFEVDCAGNKLPAHDAVFYKVIKLVKYRYSDGRDYAVLQLRGAPPLDPVPVRNSLPAIGEAVFGIHHPNGAVKKVSPEAGTTSVLNAGLGVGVNLDVAGGSSGSGLFDMSGRIVGVLANGGPCGVTYSSMATLLSDPIDIPDPPTERAVMLVLDRSGSMSESAGDGAIKIEEARDAAELFVSMLRASMGNEAGLVSFSANATAPVEFGLTAVAGTVQQDIIDELPGITPGGGTSIGDGLAAARDEFGGAAPPRAILVLTDGMENEPLAIADVGGLGGIEITAIGFGTESNLDGATLSDLAQTHGGFYKRAGSGLELRKFFALAFGDIFEAGALSDPDMHLPARSKEGRDVPFHVCGEEAITVVLGWNDGNANLLLEVRTPSGQVVDLSAGGIETDSGSTWRFARIPLPQAGERDGVWRARVRRGGHGSTEFPPPDEAVTYFISVIATGGPSLRPYQQPRRLYTGDVIHPKVILQYRDESMPTGGRVEVSMRRPTASVGTILAAKGLAAPSVINGDVIPARQATLLKIEQETGSPVASYVSETHTLSDGASGAETFRPVGIFGKRLEDVLVVEGTYTFHAKARYGAGCTGTREVQWSHHVKVGVDPDATTVVTQPSGGGRVRVTITPKDRYGNLVGPGAGDDLDIAGLPGCTLVGSLTDHGDGRYTQEIECDPDHDGSPGISVGQPGRDPVPLTPSVREKTLFRYAVKLICGTQADGCCDCDSVAPGRYTTAITLYNGGPKDAKVAQHIVPTRTMGTASGLWPNDAKARARDRIALGALAATTIDCCTVSEMLLGAKSAHEHPVTMGMVILESPVRLAVSAAYTVVTGDGDSPSLHIETISPEAVSIREARQERTEITATVARPQHATPPPRPQDVQRKERTLTDTPEASGGKGKPATPKKKGRAAKTTRASKK